MFFKLVSINFILEVYSFKRDNGSFKYFKSAGVKPLESSVIGIKNESTVSIDFLKISKYPIPKNPALQVPSLSNSRDLL